MIALLTEARATLGLPRIIAEAVVVPLVLLLGLAGPMVVFGG